MAKDLKPANYKDLTNKRFGRLIVICEEGRNNKGEILWYCKCDCGNSAIVSTSNLNRGNTMSCGCLRKELHQKRCKQLRLECEERKLREREEKAKESEEKKLNKFVDKFNVYYGHAFEYISGYESNNTKSFIVIRCKECGHIRERSRTEIFQGDNIICNVCGANRKGVCVGVCAECGTEFKQYSVRQTLCKQCHDKQVKQKRNAYHEARERKARANGKIDYSITLSKLIERDNHICQLCGRLVDETDYTYINDTFIAGNNYPSIDHIKPLSKGGVHQWDNVQLAHRLCNSLKCDKDC